MASNIGERIRFIRNLREITQKQLGIAVGFPEKNADIRMHQYESGSRSPREELTEKFAEALDVSPAALSVPNIDDPIGVMHTLFALEDLYGLKIDVLNGEIVLQLERKDDNEELFSSFLEWLNEALLMRSGEISRAEYDNWRYNYENDENDQKQAG